MKFFYQPKKIEKENSPVNNYLTSSIVIENKNFFFPEKHFKNNSFSENIELLKRNDKILNVKIQEIIDKIFDYQYNKNKNFNKISKIVSYYCSYWKKKNLSL